MIAIIHLERGIPSKRASSKHIDYVPALCTHRPSLLPIEWVSELHELMFELVLQHGLWEVNQTCPFRGSKSRNKVNSYWSLAQLVPGLASWARRDKLKVEPQRYCQTAGNVKLGRSACVQAQLCKKPGPTSLIRSQVGTLPVLIQFTD